MMSFEDGLRNQLELNEQRRRDAHKPSWLLEVVDGIFKDRNAEAPTITRLGIMANMVQEKMQLLKNRKLMGTFAVVGNVVVFTPAPGTRLGFHTMETKDQFRQFVDSVMRSPEPQP